MNNFNYSCTQVLNCTVILKSKQGKFLYLCVKKMNDIQNSIFK